MSEAKIKSIFTALNDYDSVDELITIASPYASRPPSELASRLEEKYKIKPADSDILSAALLQLAGQTQQRAYKAKGQPPSMFICHSKVMGTTFQPNIPWNAMKPGDILELKHESNEHDPDAVAVYHRDTSTKLGYISKELVKAQQLHVDTDQYWAEITNITGGGDKNHGCNIKIFYSSENGKQRSVSAAPARTTTAKPAGATAAAMKPIAFTTTARATPSFTPPVAKPAFQRAPAAAAAKPAATTSAPAAAKAAKHSDPHFVTYSKVMGVSSYPVPWDQIEVDDRLDLVADSKKQQVTIVHQKTQQKMGHVNPALVEKFNMLEDIKSKRYEWWGVVNKITGGNGRQQGCNIDLCSSRGPEAAASAK